jgi:hypothetical protein
LLSRETIDALADIRAAQPAYVAAGQGVAFWVAKVTTTGDTVRNGVAALRQQAQSHDARAALDTAAASLQQFADIDKRAIDYINSTQPLMAGDVIFAEGTQAGASVAHELERARLLERQAADAAQGAARRLEAGVAAGAAIAVALLVVLLVPVRAVAASADSATEHTFDEGRTAERDAEPVEYARRIDPTSTPAPAPTPKIPVEDTVARRVPTPRTHADGLRLTLDDVDGVDIPLRAVEAPRQVVPEVAAVAAPSVEVPADNTLKLAADLAVEFGRARDIKDLQQLLARAAGLMDASGMVVWMGNAAGSELRPLLTHGYSLQMVARLSSVPRAANNAAANAFRTGKLQVVRSQAGSSGAIVAPILTAGGCAGAVSAEFRNGEASDRAQALASLMAAQLAGILVMSPAEQPETETKAAAG